MICEIEKKSVRELAQFFGGLDYVAIGPGRLGHTNSTYNPIAARRLIALCIPYLG
jgi:hypothetical protein